MFDVVVIGGGPAGSSAAIRLAQSGRRVRLYEKATFPRRKLCGGFLSGESLRDLEQLGILTCLKEQGAIIVRRVVVTSCSGKIAQAPLDHEGLSISRDVLDQALLLKAQDTGVDVRMGENGLNRDSTAEWTIQACGRKSKGKGFTGIQAFFNHVPDVTDQVELHFVPGGYVGLVRQNGGRVNVCALTHRNAFSEQGHDLDAVIAAWKCRNPILKERLKTAHRLSPWLAVGPVTMGVRQLTASKTFFTGDAASVVDPFVGEGLAMALRSSDLLNQALASPADPQAAYEKAWHATFDSSLRLQRWLRWGMSHPYVQEALVFGLHAYPAALTRLNAMTRPPLYEHDHAQPRRSIA